MGLLMAAPPPMPMCRRFTDAPRRPRSGNGNVQTTKYPAPRSTFDSSEEDVLKSARPRGTTATRDQPLVAGIYSSTLRLLVDIDTEPTHAT
eukprot:scaffold965_cov120-Isochrysis_galbana.AAC.3